MTGLLCFVAGALGALILAHWRLRRVQGHLGAAQTELLVARDHWARAVLHLREAKATIQEQGETIRVLESLGERESDSDAGEWWKNGKESPWS